MKWYKILVIMLAACMLATAPVMAGNIPEYDAVGCDDQNFFAMTNSAQYRQVTHGNWGPYGPINFDSAFDPVYSGSTLVYGEDFWQTAGQLFPDPCFEWCHQGRDEEVSFQHLPPFCSALTSAWNQGEYYWSIVLQMKPESDINLNIYDCVLKHNNFSLWNDDWDQFGTAGAEQTGRYRADSGRLMWVPSANPSITVTAYPGPWATNGFDAPFIMDGRTLPGLNTVSMNDVWYTSKALWDEELVLKMPETLDVNVAGDDTFFLKQGDRIVVKVAVPFNNTCDIRYGADSVLLKYIGIVGHWEYSYDQCRNFCDFPDF